MSARDALAELSAVKVYSRKQQECRLHMTRDCCGDMAELEDIRPLCPTGAVPMRQPKAMCQ